MVWQQGVEDPKLKATRIASREADKVWEETQDLGKSAERWFTVFNTVLPELAKQSQQEHRHVR